jgi:hypothetical protein
VTYPTKSPFTPIHSPRLITIKGEGEGRFHGNLRTKPWDSRIEARILSSNPVGSDSPPFQGYSSTLTMSGGTPCLGFARSTFPGTISWISLVELLLYGPRTESNQWLMYSMAALLGAQPRVYTEPGGTEFPNPVAPVSAQRTCPTWGFCSRKFNCIYLW